MNRLLCIFRHLSRRSDGFCYSKTSSNHYILLTSRYFEQHCFVSHSTFYRNLVTEVSSFHEDVDVSAVTNGDEALKAKLKVLILEMDLMRQEGHSVPSQLKVDEWKELLAKETRSSRRRYIAFLWKKEILKTNDKKKKIERRMKMNENKDSNNAEASEHIGYGLSKNTIFMRIRDSTMNHFYNWKLMQAVLFGQKLVIDCGFDENMNTQESINCAKQLVLLFAENRFHVQPFNLYFCNAIRSGTTIKTFEKNVPTVYDSDFPLNITQKCYLDLFPKENLVYLTPHCREELTEFDHDATYIIGGIVDKVNQSPLSLAKAKKQNLKMAKLPLDRYLLWGSGSGKSLTLDQMIKILLEIKYSGNWEKALKHVPKRKLIKEDNISSLLGKSVKNVQRRNKYGFKF